MMRFQVFTSIILASSGVLSFANAQGASQTIVLPPMDLATNETAQVDIMSTAANYPGWSFVTPCNVLVNFFGQDGSKLQTSGSFKVTNTGQVFSVDLPYAATGAISPSTSVSVQLALTPASAAFEIFSPPVPPCATAFSLEAYDTAGLVTHNLITGQAAQGTENVAEIGAVSVLPCLDGPSLCTFMYAFEQTPTQLAVLPPVSISASETVQVDVMSSSAGSVGSAAASCSAAITFYGADGSQIGTTSKFTLGTTNQIFAASLPFALTNAKTARTAVSAQLALTPSPIPSSYPALLVPPCITELSLRVFDTTSGVTRASISGHTNQITLPSTIRQSSIPSHHQ